MAELNQIKSQLTVQNLFLIGKKLNEKVAHASFLHCSAYIVLGQDDDLKINYKDLIEP